MKKKLVLGLILTMAVSSAACGQASTASTSTTSTTATASVSAEQSAEESVTEDTATSATSEAAAPEEAAEQEAPALAETVDSADGTFAITTMQAANNQVLVVYPKDSARETSLVSLTCTAPALVVFGDTAFDNESACAYAKESGLADIAAAEGSVILFVNPSGATWSDDDQAAYEALVGMLDNSSTSDVAAGIATGVNFMTQQMEQKISAETGRIYLYGIGTGADFVANHFVKKVISSVTYGDGVTMEFDRTPTAVTLVGATTADGADTNDMTIIADECAPAVAESLKAVSAEVVTNDTADFTAEYATQGKYRRQAGVLIESIDWAEEGITETVETYTVNTSDDNVTFADADTHDIKYITYYADDLDVKEGNVPLVLCFHGGGNTALYEAQATQWPLIGKEHGFITVSVDLHYPEVTATETIDLINHLEEEYSIDKSRIYASGFSMGGVKSWDLYEQYPEVFAGLAPMDATNQPGVDSFNNEVADVNADTLTPVFYVGGELTPLPELANQDQRVVDRISNLFTVNEVTTPYDVDFNAQDSWKNKFWGVNGDLTYTVTDTTFTDSTMTVDLFASQDGKYYTALALSGNQSHEVYARNSWAAYDFLSQFSRNEDGSISINAVDYSRPSDDGAVTSNSYNE